MLKVGSTAARALHDQLEALSIPASSLFQLRTTPKQTPLEAMSIVYNWSCQARSACGASRQQTHWGLTQGA